MTENEIFKMIQRYLSDVPLILVGTGGSIPLGIPGMKALSDHILFRLSEKYESEEAWRQFSARLQAGVDLESALTNIQMPDRILNDVAVETWKLITKSDLRLLHDVIHGKIKLPMARLIRKLYHPNPQCVNMITTNYDRMIEYACDEIGVKVNAKFDNGYIKHFSPNKIQKKKTVNLLKVHGSLDLFKDKKDNIYSVPVQSAIPKGLVPEIITPGAAKYRSVLQEPYRQILHEADNLIDRADCYLCIGYGFNDEQIQTNMIAGIKTGKPIVVVTKTISNRAFALIEENSSNYVIIQEAIIRGGKGALHATAFIVKGGQLVLTEPYWTIDGFMQIIGG